MLEGSYYNRLDQKIEVSIGVSGINGVIGDDVSGIFFAGDEAVATQSQINDTFDVLVRTSATITLLCQNYIPNFFASNATDISVVIKKDGMCVFAGFVEPQAYSQDYNDELDQVELSCIDAVSAFQYSKYKAIGSKNSYKQVKMEATRMSFQDIIAEIINDISNKLGESLNIHYDNSKSLPSRTAQTLFSDLKISELLFLGDTEDDVWTNEEVMTQMLQYLNLHMMQVGTDLYVFDWKSLKNKHFGGENVTIESHIAVGDDHKLTICETYNQIKLECDVKSIDDVMESPLDSKQLISPYRNKQKYLTEYSSLGEGRTAYDAFGTIVSGGNTDYSDAKVTEWFMQVKNNMHWRFNIAGQDAIATYCSNNTRQHELPNALRQNAGAAIISFGSIEKKSAAGDDSPVSKVDMSDYLIVSVNGNGIDSSDTTYPQPADIKANIPYATYTGNISGGVFSPVDEETVNYIVLSGKIGLNPVLTVSKEFNMISTEGVPWHGTVPTRKHGDGRYYTQQWWRAETPSSVAESDESNTPRLVPFVEDGPEEYEFKYSAIGDSTDHVSKVAVLACMLVIGDKCVVEKGTSGQIDDFEWQTYKALENCSSEDEYYQQCFYIGFNPKIGDKLIGSMFDIQNNISYTLGIDAEGIAIPIRKSDHVSGKVQFKILGPVNTVWSEVTRRHPTFFRHTKWGENQIPLLAHVSSIVIKELEMKVYSNNAFVNNSTKKDLVYVSDTFEQFVNKKDDIHFKINSSLTSEECKELEVSNSVKMSSPMDNEGKGVVMITDHLKQITNKAEKLYVDAYYSEYHLPRVSLETTLEDRDNIVSPFNLYYHPAIGKTFFVEGVSRNLDSASATLILKEL